jgi:hypothetical protein
MLPPPQGGNLPRAALPPEDKRIQAEEEEELFNYKEEKCVKEAKERVKKKVDKRVRDKMEKPLEEKLFKYKKEEQQAEEEKEAEPWTNFNSMAPSPSHSRSSHTLRSFQEYQSEDTKTSTVLQGVVNCLSNISNQMLMLSERLARMEAGPGSMGHCARLRTPLFRAAPFYKIRNSGRTPLFRAPPC